jgi:hypothetical protein
MGIFDVIALAVTGVVGMLGWFAAWRARGDTLETKNLLAAATAGEVAARELLLEANAKASTAATQASVAMSRADSLQMQLDAERKARQSVVDAMAKSGVPVGPLVVDDALGRLYPDGDAGNPGAGSNPGAGGSGVPGQLAPLAPRTTTRR